MKKCMKIIPFILAVCFLFSACTSDSLVTTQRTTEPTTEKTTETLTETAEITTEATTQKEIYYPTEEEYMELFDKRLAPYIDYTKSYDSSTNAIVISWDVFYSRILTLHYSASLMMNEENRITWCMVNVYHEKFGNNFELLSAEGRTDVLGLIVCPSYILACFHSNQEYDEKSFVNKVAEATKGLVGNERKCDLSFFDCDYYASLNDETGITSMLDYGGKTH